MKPQRDRTSSTRAFSQATTHACAHRLRSWLRRSHGLLLAWVVMLLISGGAQAHLIANPDGTVTDSHTGLIWDRCAWGQTWNGDTCTGEALTLDWHEALQASVAANAAAHAGQSDWRVPDLRELESLLDLGRFDPAIDTAAFPNAPATPHWSATPTWVRNIVPEREYVPLAYTVDFADGDIVERQAVDTSLNGKFRAQLRLVRLPGVFDLKDTPIFGEDFPLTLSVIPAQGGTLSCAPNPVPAGADTDCTLTAQPGYTLVGFEHNGNDALGQVSHGHYRLSEVIASHVLSATFASTATTTQLSVSPGATNSNETVTLNATVSSEIAGAGTVSFFADGVWLGSVAMTGGGAQMQVSSLPVGTHALTARYDGDGRLQASTSAAVSHTVRFTQGGTVALANPLGGADIQVALDSVIGDPACAITQLAVTTSLPATLPAGLSFPVGLVDVVLDGCGAHARITLRITYPNALPPGTSYWKYGPTPDDPTYHWYPMPSETVSVTGNVVTLTLTDGAIGDDDLTVNGRIVDIGGPAVFGASSVTPIPFLNPTGLLALIAALPLLTAWVRRRKSGHQTQRR